MARRRSIADLAVSVSARTGGLRRGLKRARKDIEGFAGRLKSLAKTGASVTAKLAGIGTGVLTAGVGLSFRRLDRLEKTAKKLGFTAPGALLALGDAAEESGVSTQVLEMGLQRMRRRVQEAAKGTGEAVKAIAELGLNAERLNMMTPEQQVVAFSKALNQSHVEGRRLALTQKLVDSEGVALINTFDLINKKGLQPFIDKVKETNRDVSFEDLGKISKVNDQFRDLGKRVSGIFTQIALAVSGPVSAALERLENFLRSGDVVKAMADFFGDMRDNARDFTQWIRDGKSALDDMVDVVDKLLDKLSAIPKWLIDAGRVVAAAGHAAGATAGALVGTATTARTPNQAAAMMSGFMPQIKAEARELLGDTPERFAAAVEELKTALDGGEFWRRFNEAAGRSMRGGTINGRPIDAGEAGTGTINGRALRIQEQQLDTLRRIDQRGTPLGLPPGTMIIRVQG